MQLAIVAPCYNEQEVLPETSRRLLDVLERLAGEGLGCCSGRGAPSVVGRGLARESPGVDQMDQQARPLDMAEEVQPQAAALVGALVALVARRGEVLEQLARQIEAKGGRARAVPCDVTDPEAVAAALERVRQELGEPDILVNAAGIGVWKPFAEIPVDAHRAMMDVNYWGAFHWIRAVLPGMRARKRGRVVNVSSTSVREPIANLVLPAVQLFQATMGIGGLLAVAGGLAYILIAVVTVFFGRPFRPEETFDRSGVPQGIWKLPRQVHTGSEVAVLHAAGTPGTLRLVYIFFACFVLYYFANWKILSFLWKVG